MTSFSGILRRRPALGVWLAIAALALALVPAAAYAYGEKEEQLCYSCSSVTTYGHTDTPSTGQTHWEVEGWNTSSKKGVCAAFWENLAGGGYKEYPSCTSSGEVAFVNINREVTGHGEARRYYKQYLYNLLVAVWY